MSHLDFFSFIHLYLFEVQIFLGLYSVIVVMTVTWYYLVLIGCGFVAIGLSNNISYSGVK